MTSVKKQRGLCYNYCNGQIKAEPLGNSAICKGVPSLPVTENVLLPCMALNTFQFACQTQTATSHCSALFNSMKCGSVKKVQMLWSQENKREARKGIATQRRLSLWASVFRCCLAFLLLVAGH